MYGSARQVCVYMYIYTHLYIYLYTHKFYIYIGLLVSICMWVCAHRHPHRHQCRTLVARWGPSEHHIVLPQYQRRTGSFKEHKFKEKGDSKGGKKVGMKLQDDINCLLAQHGVYESLKNTFNRWCGLSLTAVKVWASLPGWWMLQQRYVLRRDLKEKISIRSFSKVHFLLNISWSSQSWIINKHFFLLKFRDSQHWEQDESKAWEICHVLNPTRAHSSNSCLMFSGEQL